MGHPRLTKRKMPTPQEKANFVSFQDSRNDSSNSFTNSFEALRMVKENSMIGELRSHPNNKMKGAGHQSLIILRRLLQKGFTTTIPLIGG